MIVCLKLSNSIMSLEGIEPWSLSWQAALTPREFFVPFAMSWDSSRLIGEKTGRVFSNLLFDTSIWYLSGFFYVNIPYMYDINSIIDIVNTVYNRTILAWICPDEWSSIFKTRETVGMCARESV